MEKFKVKKGKFWYNFGNVGRHEHGKRDAQACTIGLSINEDPKLEKGRRRIAAPLDILCGPRVT